MKKTEYKESIFRHNLGEMIETQLFEVIIILGHNHD